MTTIYCDTRWCRWCRDHECAKSTIVVDFAECISHEQRSTKIKDMLKETRKFLDEDWRTIVIGEMWRTMKLPLDENSPYRNGNKKSMEKFIQGCHRGETGFLFLHVTLEGKNQR